MVLWCCVSAPSVANRIAAPRGGSLAIFAAICRALLGKSTTVGQGLAPDSGHRSSGSRCPLCAISRLIHCSNCDHCYFTQFAVTADTTPRMFASVVSSCGIGYPRPGLARTARPLTYPSRRFQSESLDLIPPGLTPGSARLAGGSATADL